MRRTNKISFVAAFVAAFGMLMANFAFADNLKSDLNAAVNGDDTTINVGNVTGGASEDVPVLLYVQDSNGDADLDDSSSTVVVSGSGNHSASMPAVTISDYGKANGQTGTITFTAPASQATAQAYTVTVTFSSVGDTVNESPATVTINFSVPATVVPSDTAAPSILCSPAASDGLWHNANQSVVCTASDTSGLRSDTPSPQTLSTSVDAGVENSNASTDSYQFCDIHNNCATAGPITGWKIDRKAPTIATTGPTTSPNGAGWYNSDVIVGFTAQDDGAGLGSFVSPFTKTTSGEGNAVTVSSGAVSDAVNNTNNGISSASFQIDKTAPGVACATPAPRFTLNDPSPAAVTASVSDGLSLPVNATATAAPDVSSIGTKTASVTGYDNAGNSTTVACSYTVGVNFTGFSAPVDKAPWVNKAKAGKAVPLKWRATDANNNPVSNLTNADVKIIAKTLTCSTGTSADLIEEYSTDGTGLQNLSNGYYQFDWKSPTTYVNSCKTVTAVMGGVDGPSADFTFTK